jgi:ribose transport system substrate-binding protein
VKIIRTRKALVAGLAVGVLALSTACSSGGGTGGAESSGGDEPYRIAFSFGQSIHPFFVAMQKGAEDAAEELGVELTTSSADFNLQTQVENIENDLQKQVDAILVNPVDSEALATTVVQATSQNVPVFAVDINITGAEVTSFIASDNVEIGRMAGEAIIEELGGEGKVALIGWPAVSSTRDRETGFMEAIEEAPGIELVATSGDATERTAALDAAENILQSNPDLDAVFGANEAGALGALGAAEAQGRDDLYIVGVDATPDLLTAIQSGTQVKAAIGQDPYLMGKTAVELAVQKLDGEDVEANVPVTVELITPENVQEFIDREAQYAG